MNPKKWVEDIPVVLFARGVRMRHKHRRLYFNRALCVSGLHSGGHARDSGSDACGGSKTSERQEEDSQSTRTACPSYHTRYVHRNPPQSTRIACLPYHTGYVQINSQSTGSACPLYQTGYVQRTYPIKKPRKNP